MEDYQFRPLEDRVPSEKSDPAAPEEENEAKDPDRDSQDQEEWTENFKLELVAKFCQWLEKQHLHKVADIIRESRKGTQPASFFSVDEIPFGQASGGRVDLFTLFSELSALKQETKIINRQSKAGLEQWEKMHESTRQAIEALQREQNQHRLELPGLKALHLRPLLLGILDIRDRMERGIKAAQKTRPSSWLVRMIGQETGMEEFVQGQQMTMRNLDRLLASYGVTPLEAEGKRFDPHTMRAVEIEERLDLADGQVIEEIRKGFLLQEEILRPSEVKVNKQNNGREK